VHVGGRVLDGAGTAIDDAVVEVWSPDAAMFARSLTDDEGRWSVQITPGPYLAIHVFARGLLRHLTTRICFDAAMVPDSVSDARRGTLLPARDNDGYRFDIRIQGEHETVFFDR